MPQYRRFKKDRLKFEAEAVYSYALIATMISNTKTSAKKKSYIVIGIAPFQGQD